VTHDFVAVGVGDGDLAVEDRNKWIASIADALEHLADIRHAFLAECGKCPYLRRRQGHCWRRDKRTRSPWHRRDLCLPERSVPSSHAAHDAVRLVSVQGTARGHVLSQRCLRVAACFTTS
jgi:hypothetical protein